MPRTVTLCAAVSVGGMVTGVSVAVSYTVNTMFLHVATAGVTSSGSHSKESSTCRTIINSMANGDTAGSTSAPPGKMVSGNVMAFAAVVNKDVEGLTVVICGADADWQGLANCQISSATSTDDDDFFAG